MKPLLALLRSEGRTYHVHNWSRELSKKYGLTEKQLIRARYIRDQVDACRCDEARRLILGVTRKRKETAA